jgi:hypothetical protein
MKSPVACNGLTLLVILLLAGCSSSPCNNTPQRPPDTKSDAQTILSKDEGTDDSIKKLPPVNIYKNTGEQQCGEHQGIPLDEMQSVLTKNKIIIYEARTQSDGLVHMTVCGAPSGKIHVFSIPQRDLKKAKKLGFKVWKDRP